MISKNLAGIHATDLTPDLIGFDLDTFLSGLRMAPAIDVRHTVGLVDPITVLRRLVESVLFVEQPIKRRVAISCSVTALAEDKPLEIDESDDELSSFPAAIALGYTGVSSKNCKGFTSRSSMPPGWRSSMLEQVARAISCPPRTSRHGRA
jgi:hypothetical protein